MFAQEPETTVTELSAAGKGVDSSSKCTTPTVK